MTVRIVGASLVFIPGTKMSVQSRETELFPSSLHTRAWMNCFLECEGRFAGTIGVAAVQRSNPFSWRCLFQQPTKDAGVCTLLSSCLVKTRGRKKIKEKRSEVG